MRFRRPRADGVRARRLRRAPPRFGARRAGAPPRGDRSRDRARDRARDQHRGWARDDPRRRAPHPVLEPHRHPVGVARGLAWISAYCEPFTHLDPRFEALWDDPRLVEPREDMLGVAGVAPYTCKLNLKRPREGSEFPWHQDLPVLVRLHRRPGPGDRHRHPLPRRRERRERRDPRAAGLASRGPRAPGSQRPDALPRRSGPHRLGTGGRRRGRGRLGRLFFPSLLLHRSSPNTSGRERRAVLLSFQPAGRPPQRELEWQPARVHELP